jgi:hypothetical protein
MIKEKRVDKKPQMFNIIEMVSKEVNMVETVNPDTSNKAVVPRKVEPSTRGAR